MTPAKVFILFTAGALYRGAFDAAEKTGNYWLYFVALALLAVPVVWANILWNEADRKEAEK